MKVCIFWGNDKHQGAWDNMLSAFGVTADNLYVIVLPGYDSSVPGRTAIVGAANILETAEHLPPGPLVVASPKVANAVPGVTSLYEFVHPENAIYVFGADNISLHPNFFGTRALDYTIHVPTSPAELNSITAATAVLYDRRYKEWLTR